MKRLLFSAVISVLLTVGSGAAYAQGTGCPGVPGMICNKICDAATARAQHAQVQKGHAKAPRCAQAPSLQPNGNRIMVIQVFLDASANPPVTVDLRVPDVDHGNQTIKWERGPNQAFTFASLSGLPNPPFDTPRVSDSEITVTDRNTGAVAYGYTIVVNYNGRQYSTTPSQPPSSVGWKPIHP